MCGRFTITLTVEELKKAIDQGFKLELSSLSLTLPHYNITPSMRVPVVSFEHGAWRLQEVPWQVRSREGHTFINTRLETLRQTAFCARYQPKVCVVPLSGFYEWDKAKQPYYVETKTVVYAAGLILKGSNGDGISLLTHAAWAPLKEIHDRQPLLITEDKLQAFLKTPLHALEHFITLTPPLNYYPVSKKVNSPKINHPSNLEPHTMRTLFDH